MAAITELVVYDSVLFNRTGQVRRWADGLERTFTRHAIDEAPLNKRMNKNPGEPPRGHLKASISGGVDRIGPRFLQTTISANAYYAEFVLGGTGPIFAEGPYMNLPKNTGFGRSRRHQVVSGQKPNNFLGRAAAATARRHPSIRGMEHLTFSQF